LKNPKIKNEKPQNFQFNSIKNDNFPQPQTSSKISRNSLKFSTPHQHPQPPISSQSPSTHETIPSHPKTASKKALKKINFHPR
jgi:hypothetical protein